MPKVSATPAATAPVSAVPMGGPGTSIPAPATGFNVPAGVPPPMMASSNPDRMVQAGLANNFNGRVASLWLLPRKVQSGKKKGVYELFCELNIQADDSGLGHDGIVTEYFKVDQLSQWVPSRVDPVWNGTAWVYTPAGSVAGQPATLETYMALHGGNGFPSGKFDAQGRAETSVLPPDDWRGWYAIPGAQNSRQDFMKGTKWEAFTKALRTLGYDKAAPHVNWGDFRQLLVGVYGKWLRMPFEFSGGVAPVDEGGDGQQKKPETLCMVELLDLGPISGVAGRSMVAGGGLAAPAAVVVAPATVAPAPAPVFDAQSMIAAASIGALPGQAGPVAATPAGGLTAKNDPRAVSDATNAILTAAVAQKPAGILKSEGGSLVYEGVNNLGLDGALALRWLNDNEWMEDDERTFGYDAAKGLIVPLPAA